MFEGRSRVTRHVFLGLLGGLAVVVLCICPAVGRSDASLAFDVRIELLRRLGAIPSFSACIVKGEDIVWRGAWGWADVYHSIPATAETQYMIGSVSKMFTAVAILQLAEQGRFALDDDVSPHLPFELRNPAFPDEPITFRMLLSHQASLASENGHFFETFCFRPYDMAELGAFLAPTGAGFRPTYWLDIKPSERMGYANIGYELLAYLVERVSGRPFADYVDAEILDPLGMTGTTYSADRTTEPAMGYVAALGIPIPLGHYEIGSLGAGGLRATMVDLGRFAAALMNGGACAGTRIVQAETVVEMQTIQAIDPAGLFDYGLGWAAFPGGEFGGHGGGAFGCGTMLRVRLSDRTAVIYSYNRLNPALPPAVSPFLNYAVGRLETALWELADRL